MTQQSRYLPKKIRTCPHPNLQTSHYSRFIYNCQKLKSKYSLICKWTIVHSYHKILLSNKKRIKPLKHKKIIKLKWGKSQKHHVKLKKPEIQSYISHYLIYETSERQKDNKGAGSYSFESWKYSLTVEGL